MSTPPRFLILLVDDDPTITDVLTRAAHSHFPEALFVVVTSFAQAAQYIESLSGRGPRLILLDINLQTGPDGFAFLALLQAHPQGRRVPVVMLSSTDEPHTVDQALTGGAAFFTRKPFSYHEWKGYVQRLRSYWFETATLPVVEFKKQPNGSAAG